MATEATLQSDALRVDVTLAPTLRISATDKRNGVVWECPGAPLVLHHWHAAYLTTRTAPVSTRTGWEFRLIQDEDRVEVQCTWPRAACGFRITVGVDGAALELGLPARRVVENRSFEDLQMAVDFLPGLGGAKAGDDGFLFIPRGLGTVCRFDKTAPQETPLLFYVGGDRALTAPVFGVVRGAAPRAAGLLGIVTDGEFNTELVLTANAGPGGDLYGAGARARLRLLPADELEDVDVSVRYCFLDGADASVPGMAKAFRSYLLDHVGWRPLRERLEHSPQLDYARTGATVQVHLAEKRMTSRMTGDGELEVKTHFHEIGEMAAKLQAAGVEAASVVLVGWNCEGRDGLYPARFPVESEVGGADAMSAALKAVRQLGYQVGALDNFTDMYRRSPAFREELAARQPGGEPWRGGIWAGGRSYTVCPRQARERLAQRDMRRLRDLGLDGILCLDHLPGPGVLRCYAADHPLTRSQYAAEQLALVHMAQETFGLCRVSAAHAFAALAADLCLIPLRDAAAAEDLDPDWFADESAPFLPLALHGVVVLAAEADADPLRAAEYGAVPVFNTSSTENGRFVLERAEFCRRYTDELAPLADQFIESYDAPAAGLAAVGYSGGCRVLVNRTDEPAEVGGVAVGPHSFRVER